MPMFRSVVLALVAITVPLAPAVAQAHRREQDQAFAALRAGQVLPLHVIEARIMPRMPGADYLGPEFDAASSVYRLKFMRGGSVIWLDVDARTGQVIGRSGY